MSEPLSQGAYYERTASHYDAMHVRADDEHGIALGLFAGLARKFEARSVLDVGAGTGRALKLLAGELPNARLIGVEPVAALREVAYSGGISRDQLIEGSGERLPFEDNSFDFVIETGMLHHVPNPEKVVAEMVRVARLGVMISDSNKLGQGSFLGRLFKGLIYRLGLWNALIYLQTRGKMSKWSEGDGVFYSYSVFDNLAVVKRKFSRVLLSNTVPMTGFDLRSDAGHLCLIAIRDR